MHPSDPQPFTTYARRPGPRFEAVIAVVAQSCSVPAEALLHPSRCRAPVADARQLAMYLCHVTLGQTMTAVGRHFARDRTTVAHACAKIEDMRDDPDADARIQALEDAVDGTGPGALTAHRASLGEPVHVHR